MQVIGSVFKNPQLLDFTDKYTITDDDFPDEFHRIAFGAIYKIHELGADRISLENIEDFLTSRPKSQAIFKQQKGEEWLLKVADTCLPDAFDYYYNRLKKFTLLRAYDNCGIDVSDIYDADNILDTKKKQIQEDLLDNSTLEQIANKVDEKMKMLASNESQRDDFRKKLNIFTCAKLYKEYKEKSEELQNYENKLKVLSSENKDFAPRINDLGFTIKTILSKELSEADSSHKQSISLKKSLNDDNLKIDSSIEENNNTINEMSKQLGELKTAVSYFDKEEDNFNKKYDEKILRNIEGYFNERDILLIDKKINDIYQNISYSMDR